MADDKTPPDGTEMFLEPEIEIIGDPVQEGKLDQILVLLKKHDREHQEFSERLAKIEANQNVLRAAYQEHGTLLASLLSK